jgi:hypothetical protein
MKKRSTRSGVRAGISAIAVITLLAAPAMAASSDEPERHGAYPMAFVGVVVGGVTWAVGMPFRALLAPRHILQGFDEMVAAPFRVTIGRQQPEHSARDQGSAWGPQYGRTVLSGPLR